MNKSAIERGMFRSVAFKLYRDEEKKSGNMSEEILKPDKNTTMSYKSHLGYHCIDEDGLPKVSMAVGGNDIVIGKVVNVAASTSDITKAKLTHRDLSTSIKTTDSGVVDNVVLTTNEEGRKMTKIRVRSIRIPEAGDKFASRAGQKGTVGLILPQEEMPFTSQGIVPDIIINPHCFVGETLVSCPGGLSRRIDSFSEQGLEPVWSYGDCGISTQFALGLSHRGTQPTVILTMEDGRTIQCTPDHKFLVTRNGNKEWVMAANLTTEDKFFVGTRGTQDRKCGLEPDWELGLRLNFHMRDPINREKTLAFARIFGWLFEGSDDNNCIQFGSEIDAWAMAADVQTITGSRVLQGTTVTIPSDLFFWLTTSTKAIVEKFLMPLERSTRIFGCMDWQMCSCSESSKCSLFQGHVFFFRNRVSEEASAILFSELHFNEKRRSNFDSVKL